MTTFRNRLKELRKDRNLTQKQLSIILNTTNSSICDWETGRAEPDLATLVFLCDYFEVSADYLLGRKDY